ncbi:MAG: glycosyltransferase [Pleurocapsa minor HA4230-MV1]|jgi:glycosyltransferase involved in cell wall biosynthesis|nr:glycosyltransferase [Pleurocapsa minor HA4230-MV1]
MIQTSINSQKIELLSNNPDTGKPYKIAIVHPSVGVNWSGGSEIFALELARRLCSYFEVELLSGVPCGDFSRPAGGISRTDAYELVRHPLIAPLWKNHIGHPEIVVEHLTNFFPCALHLLHQKPDLIFPNNDYGGLAMAAFVRALTGIPIMFTEHCGLLADGKCLARNLRFQPDRLVVFNPPTAKFAQTIKSQQAVNIIPNGVDSTRFTPEGSKLDFNLPKPIVLCVAWLNRNSHKRIELAIAAVARLPQASLLLCGDGPDRGYFEELGNKILGSERFTLYYSNYEQMPEVYRSADVFTLPSLNEPFGLAYLEAMASGLPVVATDDEMRRYVIGDGGLLCDVTNPESYADTIAQALNHDWGNKPRQQASKFNWDTIALNYRDTILDAIAKRGRSPIATRKQQVTGNQEQLEPFRPKGLLTLKGLSAGVYYKDTMSFRTPSDKDTASHIASRRQLHLLPVMEQPIIDKPKISVIIPTYNAISYLPAAVDSVLKQTFRDFELIIVDDGSSDRTAEWVLSLTDPRVKFITQENQGSAAARNKGIAIAQGAYIALFDADDIWELTKLEKQAHFLDAHSSIGLVDTSVVLIDEEGKSTGKVVTSQAEGDVWKHLVQFQPVCSCDSTPLIRRECFDTVGLFDRDLMFLEDLDWWIRLASHYQFGAIKEPLVKYRQHSGSKSTNCQETLQAFHQIIEKAFESAPTELLYLRDRGYGRVNLYLAWKALNNKDYNQVRQFCTSAIAHYPQLQRSWEYARLNLAQALMRRFGDRTYEKLRSLARTFRSFASG